MRPPEYSSSVAAVCAIVAGVRLKIGTTPVPSRAFSLAPAYDMSPVRAPGPARRAVVGHEHREGMRAGDGGRVDGVVAEAVGELHPVERGVERLAGRDEGGD